MANELPDLGPAIAGRKLATRSGSLPQMPLMLVGVAAILLAIGILRTAWLGDDAMIIFRPVLNALNGYGFVFNIGERVQAVTCPLWMFMLTAATWLTGELFVTTIILSIMVAAAAVTLLTYGAWRQGGWHWGLALALLGLALSRTFVEFATSGLETPLICALIAALVLAIERQRVGSLGDFALVALVFGLALMTRLDLLVLLGPAMLVATWQARRPAAILGGGLLGALPLLAWAGWSVVTYGSVIPNTAHAKLAGYWTPIAQMRQGAHYVLHSLTTDAAGALLLGLGGLSALAARRLLPLALALGIVLNLAYVVRVGGDFMVWRFMLPAVFTGALLLSRLPFRVPAPAALGTAAVLLALGLWAGAPFLSSLGFGPADQTGTRGIVIERAWYYQPFGLLSPNRKSFDVSGWDTEHCDPAKPSKVVKAIRIGDAGLRDGPCTYVLDVVGLSDPLLARLPPIDVPDLRVGHLYRNLPEGYAESVARDANLVISAPIAALYDAVRKVTRGKLWSMERFHAMLEIGRLSGPAAAAHDRTPPYPRQSLDPGVAYAPWGPLTDGIDIGFVAAKNREIAILGGNPLSYYRQEGWRSGIWPNTLFDPHYYRDRYGAQLPAEGEPLQHYLETGWKQGFQPSEAFDGEAYLRHNPDVRVTGMNPMLHYLTHGWREGRRW